MAMLQMQRIFIYALKKDRKPILEMLQRRGVIEVSDVIPEDNVFHKMDVSHPKASFEKNISAAREAVEILNHYVPEKKGMLSSLNGRKAVSKEDYNSFRTIYEQTLRTANHIIAYTKQIAECKADILKYETQAAILEPWTGLDIPIDFSSTKYTRSFIGTLPKEWSLEELYASLADCMPVNIDIISASKEQTCIFVLCKNDIADAVYDKLRSIDFSHPGVTSELAPKEQQKEIAQRIIDLEAEILKAEEKIISLAQYREDLLFLQDYDRMRSDKYDVIGQMSQSKNIFILTGYIASKELKSLEEALNNEFIVGIETEEPSDDEDVPVLLKNNAFARPLEWVVDGFALPTKSEIDPTMIMALFYYMLFGIMLADTGYGLLMVGGCAYCLIKYGRKMEAFIKNFLTMFLYCGISTVFWGVMFGSYFGDLPDVIAKTFFGVAENAVPIIPPLWFFPVERPMLMLTFSMVLGLIHLLTGLGIKIYQLYKQKDYLGILYDAVSWFLLIVSCTLLLMSLDMIKNILGLTTVIPSVLIKISVVTAIISSIIIIATNGRESRNPFKRFLKGAYALYGITGYLSDVLSYSRLLALGLASGIIGNVINKMASMPAKMGVVGPLIFTIIVIGGHALNIAINALGAYVHTNRLQYVEFFGKFYGGGGRSFNPFSMKTKYYKVKESVENEI